MSRRICLVGASGLVGSRLMARAVGRDDVRLVGVARREVPLPEGARMEMLVAPVEGWPDAIAATGTQVLVCALGTTWRKAGKDEAAFRAVDHDLVLTVARAAKDAGIGHFILVSSVGADPASTNRYLRAKGEVEQAVGRMRFRRSDILRPGLIRGRRAEPRPLERAGMIVSPVIDRLLWGNWRKYRSISADILALAALALAREKAGGHFIHEHDAIHYAIRRGGDNGKPRTRCAVDLAGSASHARRRR
ncbi:MAG: NAD(P)H-binding protein [Novosphingobium sp.]|nr:NAD(P)H-binding protein [Novosphingobium sp.]